MTGLPFRYKSPVLQEAPVLYECPVGKILREAPQTYDIIELCGAFENADPLVVSQLPRYLTRASRIVGSERERIREIRRSKTQNVRDGDYANTILRGRG